MPDEGVRKRKVGLLALNPEPLKIVPSEARDVWTRQPRPHVCEFCGSTLAALEDDEITREIKGHSLSLLVYRCVDRAGCRRRQREWGVEVTE